MDSTTLVTFLYLAPHHVSTVELLGSWDNFTKPYPMQRDKSVSPQSWKGCHSFSDIVCDGDVVAMDGSTRQGGLQMGGTYWYYYRLDNETECNDPAVISTRGCPFLPGQEVNVLDVPVQKHSITCESTASLLDVFTLDPAAKFASPKPSEIPISSTLSTRAPPSRASSLRLSFFNTIPKFSLSRSRSTPNRRCVTAPSPGLPRKAGIQLRPRTESHHGKRLPDNSTTQEFSREPLSGPQDEFNVFEATRSRPVDDLGLGLSYLNLDEISSVYSANTSSLDVDDDEQDLTPQGVIHTVTNSDHPRPGSNRTSGVFSQFSHSALGSPLSTNRHSYFNAQQPQTPSLPTFDSFLLEPLQLDLPDWSHITEATISLPQNPSQLTPYLQSEKESASTLTIRQPASFLELNHTAKLSPLEKLDMVESWRHGESPSTVPEAEPSTLQDLINDLGYLSSMIA